jgi:ribosome biogenesis GTPase
MNDSNDRSFPTSRTCSSAPASASASSASTPSSPPSSGPDPARAAGCAPGRSLDLAALRRLGLDAPVLERALMNPPAAASAARLARVVEVRRDRWLLHDGAAIVGALPWPALRARLQVERDALVVGDWVWFEPSGDAASVDADADANANANANADLRDPGGDGLAWITGRVPPLHRLTRRDPAGGLQPLVANIDTALLVMGLDRDFKLARLDRFLVLAQGADVEIVIVLTKADLRARPDDAAAQVRAHVGQSWPVVTVDARDADASAALAPWVRTGRTLALLGSSGAGKSTLARTLLAAGGDACAGPGSGVPTAGRLQAPSPGAVRDSDDRGRHTTTARTLHVTHAGACLVDTPGLRQLGLDMDEASLEAAFSDIAALAPQCRYRDCAHAGEPGCAVAAQVPAERLRSFHKLMREAQREALERDALARRRQRTLWKMNGQAGRERAAEKRRG